MKLFAAILSVILFLSIKSAYSQSKDSTELIIRKMKYYPVQEKFDKDEFSKLPIRYWVLKIYKSVDKFPTQHVLVPRNNKKSFYEFEPYKSFDAEDEVLEFAKLNNINEIELDPKKVEVMWRMELTHLIFLPPSQE